MRIPWRPRTVPSSPPRRNAWIGSALAFGLAVALNAPPARAADSSQVGRRQRMVVLTDIEADPDDTQTLVRLLLYSNVIDIEGLIATTSVL